MNLNELAAEVYTLTKRPYMTAETILAIKKATIKLHNTDFYYRDLQEKVISFPVAAYKQQYDLGLNLSGYRAIKYVRIWSATPTGTERYLEVIEPDSVMDEYATEKADCWYIAGKMLNLKSSLLLSHVVIGYYKNPIITDTGYTSWIAEELPYAIIEEAAANIYAMIGEFETARRYEVLAAQQVVLLRQNFLVQEAR